MRKNVEKLGGYLVTIMARPRGSVEQFRPYGVFIPAESVSRAGAIKRAMEYSRLQGLEPWGKVLRLVKVSAAELNTVGTGFAPPAVTGA